MNDPLNTALQAIFDHLPGFPQAEYLAWIAATAPDEPAFRALDHALAKLVDPPQLEVLVAAGADIIGLLATLDALAGQVWRRFAITIGCVPDEVPDLQRLIDAWPSAQPFIRMVPIDVSARDVPALERALLAAAQGDFVAFLAPGDIVPVQATAEIVLALSRLPETIVLFTDEDWIDVHGLRTRPRFKNGWDFDAQLGFDLMGRFSPMRRTVALEAGGLPEQAGLAAHYALHCRLAEVAGPARIVHVASVLRHAGRQRVPSPELADAYAVSARVIAQDAAWRFEGMNVTVGAAPLAPWFNRITWPLAQPAPKVSILLPTRDRADLLKTATRGVLEATDYPAIELLILDNGSVEPETIALFEQLSYDPRVRVLPMPGPFNYSKLNNDGAAAASGEVLVLLNNDVEILDPGWLREMVSLAVRPEIGCVGATLLYADRRIQHAGVSIEERTGCAHVGRLLDASAPGDMGALAVTRAHSAVTGACLATRAAVFAEIGGLDVDAFEVGYNDIDLCLRARDHGYRTLCSPASVLIHLENVTRRAEPDRTRRARELRESARILGRWREIFLDDPCQNPNTLRTWDRPLHLVGSRRAREWEGRR